MQKDKTNGFDDMLRRSLDGAPSQLPADMLDRILEKNKRKRRAMFWWLNFAVGVYAIVLTVYIIGTTTRSDLPIIAESKTTSNSKFGANGSAQQSTDKSSTSENIIADQSANSNAEKTSEEEFSETTGTESRVSFVDQNDADIPTHEEGPLPVHDNPAEIEHIEQIPVPVVADIAQPETEISNSDSANSDEQNPVIANVANADSSASPVTNPLTASNDLGKDKNFFGNLHWDPFVSIGWMNEHQKLGVSNYDERRVHKDMESVLGSAPRPANGFQVNFGVRTSFADNFSFQGGVQYVNLRNHLHVDYVIEEVPVIDMDGSIRGYLEVQDSFKQRIVADKEFGSSIISMPIQVGYSLPLGPKNELVGGIGIRPQLHLVGEWVIPESINITSLQWTEVKGLFSAPATINLGYYRNEKNFTFGITGKWSPLYTRPRNLGEYVNLRTRQNEVGFLLMYKLTPKS